MSTTSTDQFEQESQVRLKRAEQRGLRLAILCRTAVTGTAFLWYLGAGLFAEEVTPRVVTILVLLAFTSLGILHIALIGTRYDRNWIKYLVYGLDMLAICAVFALVPISRSDDVPQIIAFRSYGIYFLFPLVAMACLSLSWRLVLWTGGVAIVGWWAAFVWITAQMDTTLSWSDVPSAATRSDYENIFLSIDFIGRGNRIEETAMVFFTTAALALAVYRARHVFFEQVASDLARQREQTAREHVSNLLGKYLPEQIAKRLILDDTPLKPQRAHGTALVMDIAGFTAFSSRHAPEYVIQTLDAFLADATHAVHAHQGVVISYLGDGFLVTFNAPVAVNAPESAAVAAAMDLLNVARDHTLEIRVGIASGILVTGIIGTDARQSFTVYGDTVNRAARLEAKCKDLHLRILVDTETHDTAGADIGLRPVPSVSLAGLADKVNVFGYAETPAKP